MFRNTMLLINRPVMRRFFLRTLASYLLVVLASTLALFPVFWYVRGMVQDVRIEGELDDSAAAMENLTAQLQTIQNTFLYLSGQKGFDRVSLIQGEVAPRDYIAMNNARAFLSSIKGANSLIEDIIVAFDKNDVVLTSQYVFDSRASFSSFYDVGGLAEALSSFTGQRGGARHFRFLTQATLDLPSMAGEIQVIPFCMPLSTMLTPVTSYGNIIVLLNHEQIASLLFSPSVRESGRYEITDAAGNHLAGVHFLGGAAAPGAYERMAIDGTAYASFHVEGELLHANIGIPTASFSAYANPVLLIMLRYTLIGMLAGLLFSLHSAERATRPVRKILAQLDKSGAALDHDKSAHQLILRSIDDMLEKNDRLSAISQAVHDERLGRQIDHLITGCVGEVVHDEQIPPHSVLCYALCHGGTGVAAGPSVSMLLTDYVKRLLPADWIVHPLTSEGFIVLAPCEGEEERTAFAKALADAFLQAGKLFGTALCGAVGPLCRRTDEISHAFESAKLLYYTRRHEGDGPLWLVPQGRGTNMALTIPGQTELYHLLLSGKYEDVDKRIRMAFLDSGGENAGMEQIFYTIRLVLIMAMQQQNASFHLRRYHPSATPEENIGMLLSAARSLCDITNTGKRSHNGQLLERILSYIESHFSDSELCNAAIADHVGISEKYLCSFVKEQTGRTVSDLLQSKRVGYAHSLLVSSPKPINDIWQMAGFSSHNTFYKTIRRVYGLSPSELRASR